MIDVRGISYAPIPTELFFVYIICCDLMISGQISTGGAGQIHISKGVYREEGMTHPILRIIELSIDL